AAQTNENISGHVWMFGKACQSSVELVVIGPVILHRAAGFVRDRHHTVHIGIIAQQSSFFDSVRNVLAGAGRAVDRADNRDVVAGPITAIAAIEAHKVTLLGRRWWRRTISTEGVIALEGLGRDVMHMYMPTGRDVLAGEADDLTI